MTMQGAYEAANTAREQWHAAGLQDAVELLAELVEAPSLAADPDVRQRCADEERHLRQIITLLSSDAVLMNPWFALAIAESRRRSIGLRIRAGAVDLRDQDVADAFGRLLIDCVARGALATDVVVSLVSFQDVPHLFLVGGSDFTMSDVVADYQDRLDVRVVEAVDQVLIEACPKTDAFTPLRHAAARA